MENASKSRRLCATVLAVACASACGIAVAVDAPALADRELAFLDLRRLFNDQEIVEPTVTSAFYGAVSQITRALDVKLEANAGQTANGGC